jgi:leucyl-tRNA synthetase
MNRSSTWPAYDPRRIEPRLQQDWEQHELYRTRVGGEAAKYYCLDFFPYPSGDGLHVGHCRNYVPTDVLSRYKRMKGFNVLHPMGWDAFGEPAEQYAARHGVHPRLTTDQNTANFKRQMTLIGASYDWSREINSSDPDFYRWTQYFFLLLYKRGLAYQDTNWQWWCDGCQTTLSSHEVAGGVCWRGHTSISKRKIPAWYFRITAYADELISGLAEIDWPEPIKNMQRNWIGRSEGCEIIFKTENSRSLPVFTTRPDTLFGVTFFSLAPEHPDVRDLTTLEHLLEVEEYIAQAARQSEIQRMEADRPKTGVPTGSYVIHPLTGEHIPVWVADYVLASYGTGAVMGVPAHDQRDFEFACQFRLPIRTVIVPEGNDISKDKPLETAYAGDGIMINSGGYDGIPNRLAGERIAALLAVRGLGGPKISYRMRDWLISRQRYWGTPIPMVHCPVCGIQPVPEDQLPVLLPPMQNFTPDGSGRSPLGRLPEFVDTTCPRCGGSAERETDTMGGFACSSWYFLRFASPHFEQGPFDPQAVRYWLPVDLYVGGAEHAVLHLLYARFWIRVMADAGLVTFREPFSKLLNQGQMHGSDGYRMSKSRGNVVTPDSIVEMNGADALRIYVMFMAPFDQDAVWNTDGLLGAWRFINRVWTLFLETFEESVVYSGQDETLLTELHKTIRAVEERIIEFRFNTMISTLMEFVNILADRWRSGAWKTSAYHEALETLLLLLAPAAPYMSDELWRITGHAGSIHQQSWPVWEAALTVETMVQVPVQVDGKLREVIEIPADASQEQAREVALQKERIRQQLNGREVTQVVYKPGKIISIVTRQARSLRVER